MLTLPTDVADPEQIGAAVRAAIDRVERIDALVNNPSRDGISWNCLRRSRGRGVSGGWVVVTVCNQGRSAGGRGGPGQDS